MSADSNSLIMHVILFLKRNIQRPFLYTHFLLMNADELEHHHEIIYDLFTLIHILGPV